MLAPGIRAARAARRTSAWSRALAVALLACAPASARPAGELPPAEYFATWWNIMNGLPQSSINDLVQTARGEMWIATHGGLLSFDGVEFRRYDLDTLPELRSNRISAAIEDGDNGVWFATEEGRIHRLREGRIEESHDVGRPIVVLARARDGSVWTQAPDGALRRTADGATREVLPPRGAGKFHGLCVRGDGVVCAAVVDEVVLLSPAGDEIGRMTAPAEVHSIAPDGPDGLWVGLADGLAHTDGGKIARYPIVPDPGLPVQAIGDARDGFLWLGTPRGAVRVSTTSAETPRLIVRSSLEIENAFEVRSILVDREGDVWMGAAESGLIRLRPSRVRMFPSIRGRSQVSALCDDGAGGAWVGYRNRGLTRIHADGADEDELLPVDRTELPEIHSLLRDRDGRTWAGVDSVWLRLDPTEYESFVPLFDGAVFDGGTGPMAETKEGHVWLSSQAGRLVRIGPDDEVLEQHDLGTRVQALAAADDGALWIGGADHVARLRDGRVERFGPESGLPFGTVRDVAIDAHGAAWIATYGGGLARIVDGRVQRVTSALGLADSSLSRLLFDAQGRLWMLSNLGLMVAERDDLDAVLDGRRARIEPVFFGVEAGMNEGSPGGPAGFVDARGRMWFGTLAGATRIDAADFPFNRTPPRAHVRGARADDAPLDARSGLSVPAGTRRVQIDFTAYSFAAPERFLFRYRLDGYDDDWVESRERKASYTALSPGRYVFRAMARNEDGVWSAEPAVVRIEILPAWWQTSWFRALLVLGVGGALYALHKLRIGIVQRRAEVLLEATRGRVIAEERSSRLRDELAHVARVATAGELATSLAHEVNQPLAAIVTNAEAARRYLARDGASSAELDVILRDIAQQGDRASEVIRRLRQFLRKHETERTEVDVNALVHQTLPLLRRELEELDAAVELDLDGELPAISADAVQIQQVLVNLVKNACDAMAGHDGRRSLRLVTRRGSNGVALEVHDSGPGIVPELRARLFQPYVSTKPTGMGLGLPICRTIVEAHGGRLTLLPAAATGAAFRVDLPGETRKNGAP